MPIELKIPEVGESITEVQIAEWLKAEGDDVQRDEPLVVIDSEKTTFELPAPDSGTLGKILRQAGETVPVGEVIGQLESGAGSASPAKAKPESKTETSDASEARAADDDGHDGDRKEDDDEKKVSGKRDAAAETRSRSRSRPLMEGADKAEGETEATGRADRVAGRPSRPRKEAGPKSEEEHGEKAADGADDAGAARTRKGASEKIAEEGEKEPRAEASTPRDAKAPVPEASDGEEEIVPMSMLRRTAARRLVEARRQMAMLTTFNEVDMTAVQALRREHQEAFEKRHRVKFGLMSFFVKAAVDALKLYPQLNAEVRGNNIAYRNYFNLGVAIATGRGLVVPVLCRAERMSFAEVEKAIGDFAQRARDGQLKPDELEGATFTLTNGGVFGSLLSTPIINPPQSGILGMHTIQERPVAVQGQVVIRPMMYLALTYDHRLVDGREAVLFLRRIKEAIESPARMLLEI